MISTPAGSTSLTRMQGDPLACYPQWRGALSSPEGLLVVDFRLEQYWLDATAPKSLTAIYCLAGDQLRVAVTDLELTVDGLPPQEQYRAWVSRHRIVDACSSEPIELQPGYVAKPWGREIWYSGVERRCVCNFLKAGAETPIPWLQAVLPDEAAGPAGEDLTLLKILDPDAAPVLGDLYFELHEAKREVYVVTHIDPGAWPDGVGYMRYGFDPERVERYPQEVQFRAAYLAAVRAYESVRRALDSVPEGERPDPKLLEREPALREAMNDFTGLRALRVGDVVEVPLLVPHALQHGVRAIEFQTPTYERKILSFAQKVLTQDHWDTAVAVEKMRLWPPVAAPFPVLYSAEGVKIERIVDFPDFEVRRGTLQAGCSWPFEALPSYGILIVISGSLELDGNRYRAEQALLLPRTWRGLLCPSQAPQPLVFLLALPRL